MRCPPFVVKSQSLRPDSSTKPYPPAKRSRCPSWRRVYCGRSTSSAELFRGPNRPTAPSPAYRPPSSMAPANPRVAHMAKVAFLGLGVIRFPMAGHLVKKGRHEVTVFNRTPAKAKTWTEKFGGRAAPTPQAATEGHDFVMCCVGNDNDLRAVTLGDNGAFAGMKKGATFADHTTASAEIAP